MSFGRERLLQTLAQYGYEREDLVSFPGEYAWRGGIIDVYSPWDRFPCRVELSGDEIASLREFDPSTQRSSARMPRLVVPSLREFPGSADFYEGWKRAAREAGGKPGLLFSGRLESLNEGEIFPSFFYLALLRRENFVPFSHYLHDSLFVILDPEEVDREWESRRLDLETQFGGLKENEVFHLPPEDLFPTTPWSEVRLTALEIGELFSSTDGGIEHDFRFQPVPRFENRIPFFLQFVRRLQRERERVAIFLANPAVGQKVGSLLAQNKIRARHELSPFATAKSGEILLLTGKLERGFGYPDEKIVIFSERDIFTEEKVLVSRPAARRPFVSHFQDLREHDYVVHADYGIGVFRGLVKLKVDGQEREFIEITYRDEDKLFVPVEDLNLVQKYSRVGAALPSLDKLGSPAWLKTKERTRKAIEKMARELLDLYAQRKAVQGFSFSPEGAWESEFDRTFDFEETEDQIRVIKEIRRDMESPSPMDRLVCGDVGYGKTEVAIRAAFKAVMDGKQVVVLCPTTVLASQHLQTFRNRMVLFPVRVEGLTRLQPRSKQREILADLKAGQVDIIIGTHRLLSRDVEFHDLGLLIVDEEQRFGVSHKEKIKQLKTNIDVLTLTATPIPRTLNLSLSGLRDISLIETPPKDRLAIHTVVAPFQTKLVAAAIRQELGRGGQVYYIHNRIEDIEDVKGAVEKLVPEARVVLIHGKMAGPEIEKRMMDFIAGKFNILISTTIIENGIDIPLVNTLIVDRADLFGLSQLYQLRGRVGRSNRQAYAYFLVPPYMELTPLAKERLKALKEFSQLGSGFRLAARDLEIRGAGNLLGSEQHGYLAAVGFDYFMELLDRTVRELKGEKVEETKCEINLGVDIRIPETYLPQINLRLNLYKRISSIEDVAEIDRIREEVRDRFGPLPGSVENLLRYGVVKYLAQKIRLHSIDRLGRRLILKFSPAHLVDLAGLTRALKRPGGSLSPQGILSLPLMLETETSILDETISVLKELSGYHIMNKDS